VDEIVSAHSVFGLEVSDDSTAALASEQSLDLVGDAAFLAEVKTLSRCLWGRLWPRWQASARIRSRPTPIWLSISGRTVARVCPS